MFMKRSENSILFHLYVISRVTRPVITIVGSVKLSLN